MNLETNQNEGKTNTSIIDNALNKIQEITGINIDNEVVKNNMQKNLFGQDGPSLDQAQNNQQFQNAFNNALDETNPELQLMLKKAEKKGFQNASKENEMAQLIKSISDKS